MPGTNLTREEAAERKAVIGETNYRVHLDLTGNIPGHASPETGDEANFVSTTTVNFDARPGSSTFLDIVADEIMTVKVNGKELDPAKVYKDSRISLTGLQENNSVAVVAKCQYSRTGEGLHRSVDPSDGKVYLYSQFEVPDARRVYAVFDQPDIKATFDFSVAVPSEWEVISNQPTAYTPEVAPDDDSIRFWTFKSIPVMSPYLTAICAGPYAKWSTVHTLASGRNVPMSIYCRQALKDAASGDVDYLFDITAKGMDFYNSTWAVEYPYEKYDQIFVPEYNAGAMENIGCVTIRDSYIYESKTTDASKERRVVTVLHELAHMWFGDLVTMKWWNDLWLNESFAEFTSTLAAAEATEWKDAWATFCSGEKSWGQAEDEKPTTHPIVAPINDLNDTYVNFDGITYAKGASVLRQLVAYTGRNQFFQGIHNYLEKHKYSNATLDDLLSELEATSGRDLKKWSGLWLEQSGVNTISAEVRVAPDCTIEELALVQTAPADNPVLRPHRLAVGFYNADDDGNIVRTDRIELDVDGERTIVSDAQGRKRPDFILINDDDLTYTKIRLDPESLRFALGHLDRFTDPLARAITWLSLWDMARSAELPAQSFIDTSLKALVTERESTTFRYALGQVNTAASFYVAPNRRDAAIGQVSDELWHLAQAASAGSDEQFQLLTAYANYCVGSEFDRRTQGLLDGTIVLPGLEIDNNLRWFITICRARAGVITNDDIDAELSRHDTTENREFAYKAKASIPTPEAKQWAFEQALHNGELTNSQIEAVAEGFGLNNRPELYAGYVSRFFDSIDWIWENKTFHMSETLICPLSGAGLYPQFAHPSDLAAAGKAWLDSHRDADRALRRMVEENMDSSLRVLKVQKYNAGL